MKTKTDTMSLRIHPGTREKIKEAAEAIGVKPGQLARYAFAKMISADLGDEAAKAELRKNIILQDALGGVGNGQLTKGNLLDICRQFI